MRETWVQSVRWEDPFRGKEAPSHQSVTDFEIVQKANKILNLENLKKGVRELLTLNFCKFPVSKLCWRYFRTEWRIQIRNSIVQCPPNVVRAVGIPVLPSQTACRAVTVSDTTSVTEPTPLPDSYLMCVVKK